MPETSLPTAAAPRQYAVFISYRHADNQEMGRKWANWLHEALESYEVPPDLIGKTSLRGDKVPASLYPVFRDEEELPADADLSTNIRHALENSGLLVVLCSPRAVQSRFVADEIRHFKELGKSERILALMIDGEPNASDDPAKVESFGAAAECFPEPLRFGVAADDDATRIDWTARTEPIAADVRPEGRNVQGWTTAAAYREQLVKEGGLNSRHISSAVNAYTERLELAKLKIIAGAVGLPLGELTQRNKAYQLARAKQRAKELRRWMAVVSAFAVTAIATAWLALSAKREVEKANGEIVQRNEKITSQNETNLKNLHEASMADYAVALKRIDEENKWPEGVAHLARSLKWKPGNPLAATRLYATLVLRSADKQSFPCNILSHGSSVESAQFSADGTRIVTASEDHTARVWDAASGMPFGEPLRHEAGVFSAQFSPDGTRIVTASGDNTARVWDAASGKPLGEPLRHE